ncbi:hypothetical protein ABI59_18620 [Acidobacteria bacterium Mor1]|nr:hypothetical protein ABI59_18620 [Acidobacteria bacterium Mor1]
MIPALALLATLATCVNQPADWPHEDFDRIECPQVYRIHGNAPVHQALNIVLLSAGFTEAELDDYRCGAGMMVEALLEVAPFDRYACSINVYRIDLAAPRSGLNFPDSCGNQVCSHTPPVWPHKEQECRDYAARAPGGLQGTAAIPQGRHTGNCINLDLEPRACPLEAHACQVFWPTGTGLRRLWPVSTCAPAADIVIVVANSGVWSGGGSEDMHTPLAMTTLVGIDADRTRGRLLVHEIGHTLGLMDEYAQTTAYNSPSEEPAFHEDRNLIRVAENGQMPEIPWARDCKDNQGGTACRTICNPDGCDDCTPSEGDAWPLVGLFEGGFYQECGVYRASQYCVMEDANEHDFCPVCQNYIAGIFDHMGMKTCPAGTE